MTVDGALSGREEGFPLDPLRVRDPTLFALRVATRRRSFPQDGPLGSLQPRVDLFELRAVLYLNPDVLDTFGNTALTDREIDSRVFEHPLGIVALQNGRLGTEQR
jgi:hypothetical protein